MQPAGLPAGPRCGNLRIMQLFAILLIPLVSILWLRKEVLRNPAGFRKALSFCLSFILPWLLLRIVAPELFTPRVEAGSIFLTYFLVHTLAPVFFCVLAPAITLAKGRELSEDQTASLKTKLAVVFAVLMGLDALVFELPGLSSRLFLIPVLRLGFIVLVFQTLVRFKASDRQLRAILVGLLLSYAALMWLPPVFEFFRVIWLAWVSPVLCLGLFIAFARFGVLENQVRPSLDATTDLVRKQVAEPLKKLFAQRGEGDSR